MIRQTVSIANAHDGVALTNGEAQVLASLVDLGLAGIEVLAPDAPRLDAQRLGHQVAHILRGLMRDGSAPGGEE